MILLPLPLEAMCVRSWSQGFCFRGGLRGRQAAHEAASLD